MKISSSCEKGNFSIEEDATCECCGNLSPFDITWCDGGTWWCLDGCAPLSSRFEITPEFAQELISEQKRIKKEYYKQKLAELE
ncbi:hypothetical protein D3C71_1129510 [compost metagenome]